MKVKDFISFLSKCDPEAEMNFQVGYSDIYRKVCARLIMDEDKKTQSEGLCCLKIMCVSKIEQTQFAFSEESEVNVVIVQDYLKDVYFDGLIDKEIKIEHNIKNE